MEQLVILVIIGLISFVNWLLQRSAELREKRRLERERDQGMPVGTGTAGPSAGGEQAADPAAEMRKLMEALGLPVDEEPPPLPGQPPAGPSREVFEEPPPPLPQAAPPPLPVPDRPPRRSVPAPVARVPSPFDVRPVRGEEPATARPVTAVRSRAAETVSKSAPPHPVVAGLRSARSLRHAVVLREILGPPKAFGG